jgi:hypothetical protein
VKFSTIPAESRGAAAPEARYGSLQCYAMRIEMPSATWANAAPRPEDDAHTLTVAGQSPSQWAPLELLPGTDGTLGARTEVADSDPVVLTITY